MGAWSKQYKSAECKEEQRGDKKPSFWVEGPRVMSEREKRVRGRRKKSRARLRIIQ